MKNMAKQKALMSLLDMINGEVSNKIMNKKKKKEEEPEVEIEITTIEPVKNKYLSDLRKKLGAK